VRAADYPAATAFLELINRAVQIGITTAKAARKPVAPALGNPLTIRENLELTSLARSNGGFNIEALLD
jgi:hypothetical protein